MATARQRGNLTVRERPDSPEWEYTNQKITVTRVFEGTYQDLLGARPAIDQELEDSGGIFNGIPVVSVRIKKRANSVTAAMTVVLEVDITDAKPQFEVDWTGIEQAVEKHPMFKALFPDPTNPGQWSNDQNTAYNNFVSWENSSDPSAKAAAYGKLSADFQKLAQIKMRGTISYVVPTPIARITTKTLDVAAVSPCGTISDGVPEFSGADLPQGYQWMAMSDRSTRTGKWGKWDRVQEWQGVQSYETFLYTNNG